MQTKDEIIAGLNEQFDQLLAWAESQPSAQIQFGPAGKWTSGQQLQHLLQSVAPLNTALRLPKLQLKMMFGKSNREIRDYETVCARYRERLAQGGEAPKEFLPKEVSPGEKPALLQSLEKNRQKLIKAINKWSDDDLDVFVLPHPLMGKMPVREMLFFTVYHIGHHRRALLEHYSAKDA